jgi:RimJ/RimL family protein N-acetyltransferase
MKLTFRNECQCFAVSERLLKILQDAAKHLEQAEQSLDAMTFNFRDPDYSADTGGYHPTELRIINTDKGWIFDYITDFSYQGMGYMAELTKEIDFLFQEEVAYHLYTGEHKAENVTSLFKLWQENFISYVNSGVFKVEVTPY